MTSHAPRTWWCEMKSYAPIRQSASASAVPLRPRLATTHSVLIWRGFSLFDFVWWWRARSGFSLRGETDGILSANSVDSVLPKLFSGDFDLAKPRLIFLKFGEIRVWIPPAERGLGNECGRALSFGFWRGWLKKKLNIQSIKN